MKHLFLSKELSLLAKEKGFDEDCIAYWETANTLTFMDTVFGAIIPTEKDGLGIDAPLYQQLIDWFREKHEIHISSFIQFENEVENEQEEVVIYAYMILNLKQMRKNNQNYLPYVEENDYFENAEDNSYYGSLKEAIEEAFKLI